MNFNYKIHTEFEEGTKNMKSYLREYNNFEDNKLNLRFKLYKAKNCTLLFFISTQNLAETPQMCKRKHLDSENEISLKQSLFINSFKKVKYLFRAK